LPPSVTRFGPEATVVLDLYRTLFVPSAQVDFSWNLPARSAGYTEPEVATCESSTLRPPSRCCRLSPSPTSSPAWRSVRPLLSPRKTRARTAARQPASWRGSLPSARRFAATPISCAPSSTGGASPAANTRSGSTSTSCRWKRAARSAVPPTGAGPCESERPCRSGRGRLHHFLHFAGELLQAERLRQEVDRRLAVEPLSEGILRIARDEDHLHRRVRLAHVLDEARPVH